MCNPSCIDFGKRHLEADEIRGREVLEVGSRDVNGSLRAAVEALEPSRYLGIDIREGRGVDEICPAEEIVERYGPESFDVVISTELLEHVRDWRRVMSGMKRVLRPGGSLLLTTRSRGFPHHGFPYDFWRYEPEDMRQIFADMEIDAVEPDPEAPGVYVKARRPSDFVEADLSDIELYAMALGRRVRDVTDADLRRFRRRLAARNLISALPAPLTLLIPDRVKIAIKDLVCRLR